VLFDWLAREGGIVLSWWALASLAGAAALPLCTRLVGGLPDRGYTLARAAGILLIGYVFWLLASVGFLRNTSGSIALSWLIVLVGGLLVYVHQPLDWRAWWRENRSVVIVGEILFIVLLLGWAVVRAHQNGLTATEKPMDLAFMSAVQRSETFPPNDPWLAGYAISYYYFGYMIAAMFSMASGVQSTLGFNMNISLMFALTGLTTFGVVYNLVRSRAFRHTGELLQKIPTPRGALLAGVLGMVFVTLMGNLQAALIEIPYESRIASESYLQFWNTPERTVYPERAAAEAAGIRAEQPLELTPKSDVSQWEGWWWFRASRILTDYNLDGTLSRGAQPIDEFPQFSFLLADNHPHVMALPYAMLALGLALNVLLAWRNPTSSEIVFYSLCLGGLIFLNTWDGPIYMIVLVGADGVRRLMRNGSGRLIQSDWVGMVLLGVRVLILSVIFYLPFLIGFRSQASGILPNVLNPTLFQQYFLMFGPFILILGAFLWGEGWRAGWRMNWSLGLRTAGLLLVAVLVVTLALVLAAMLIPELYQVVLRFVDENGGWRAVLPALVVRRLLFGITSVVLLAGVVMVVGRLFPKISLDSDTLDESPEARQVIAYPAATAFALLLVGAGLVLSLIPEFFYLRDNFATRINTIFKFYYQIWLIFSVASAYAVYTLLADFRLPQPNPALKAAFRALLVVVLAMGLVYPVLGIHNRMFVETGRAWNQNLDVLTLDGKRTFLPSSPGDYQAIMCLADLVEGDDVVIAEALGGPYDARYGRVGALSGLPILLGWENHEGQWRGSTYGAVVGTRPQDIRTLYSDPRWETAQTIINQYGIDYIFYGSSERADYGAGGEEKFIEELEPVCEREGSLFYHVTPTEIASR
jgi:YYY domain-containing protein